jgi:hypothetical protein
MRATIGASLIGPDADILDDRGVQGLAQVGSAGQEGKPAVGTEIEALEEAEAEGVVAGQIVHALLVKHQDAVEPLLLKSLDDPGNPIPVFATFEMQRHWKILTA